MTLKPIEDMATEKGTTKALENALPEQAPHETGTRKKPLGFFLSIFALMITVFVVSLDSTILAVAIPEIAYQLDGTTLEAFWATISFALAVVVVQPVYTGLSDVVGRLYPLYAAFLLFILGSIVFATADNMAILILGRVIQGLGGGGLDVLNEVIVADITTLKERPLYLGIMAIPLAGGSILGPILGGVFSIYANWRWIGWVNLPVCALGLALTIFFLRLKPINTSILEKLASLDYLGFALFVVGSTLFATPLAWAGAMYAWSSWQTLVPFCLGIILLAIFIWYESKPAVPILPHRLFTNRTCSLSLAAAFLHGVVAYGVVFYVPLFFQAIYLQSPLESAISILPLCCISIFFGILAAVLIEVVRQYWYLICFSWVLSAVGCGLLTLWDVSSSLAERASFQVLVGIATGTLFPILNLPMQAGMADVNDMGLAAGTLVWSRLSGALVGLALCSTLFSSIFSQELAKLGTLPDGLAMLNDVREAVGLIPSLHALDIVPELLAQIINVYKLSIFAVFWMLAGVSVIGLLVSLFIKELTLEREELGRQQFEPGSRS